MEKKMVIRKRKINAAYSFDDLIKKMDDFKKEYPNGTDFKIESDYYVDYRDSYASLTLSCKDLETDDECNKRTIIEEMNKQRDLERKRAEFEKLKKE